MSMDETPFGLKITTLNGARNGTYTSDVIHLRHSLHYCMFFVWGKAWNATSVKLQVGPGLSAKTIQGVPWFDVPDSTLTGTGDQFLYATNLQFGACDLRVVAEGVPDNAELNWVLSQVSGVM